MGLHTVACYTRFSVCNLIGVDVGLSVLISDFVDRRLRFFAKEKWNTMSEGELQGTITEKICYFIAAQGVYEMECSNVMRN